MHYFLVWLKCRGCDFVKLLSISLICMVPINGETATYSEQKRQTQHDLVNVQRKIQQEEQSVVRRSAEQQKLDKAVADSEQKVSQSARKLRQLQAQLKQLNVQLHALSVEKEALKQRIQLGQLQLGKWLSQQYMHGTSEIAPLLSSQEPNQLARDLYYLSYIAKARTKIVNQLRQDLQQQAQLFYDVASKRQNLQQLEQQTRVEQEVLDQQLAQRRQAKEVLMTSLQQQKNKIQQMRGDAQKLQLAIEALTREAKKAHIEMLQKPKVTENQTESDHKPIETKYLHQGKGLNTLQGKLLWPVNGKVSIRYGQKRSQGVSSWSGIFIQAVKGAKVRAVASGNVVFSNWLRGYGNVIILDHGQDYLTIYSNNDVLYFTVGDKVQAGEEIAVVSSDMIGLGVGEYFEIRHKGQAQNPEKWLKIN